MDCPILELNDIAVTVHGRDGGEVASPPFASLHSGSVITGDAARSQARLLPRQTNSRFWQRLGIEPLPGAAAGVRHHADLAYAHLRHLHELAGGPDRLLLAVPESFERQQLGILLGLIEQCPFDAAGIVDAAVAACAGADLHGRVTHLDLQLHQAVLTRLQADDEVVRERVDVIPDAGLQRLLDGWARMIADRFIEQCRFDPLHDAGTEQGLYDRLGGWLGASAAEEEQMIALESGGIVHRAKLRRSELLDSAEVCFRQWREALQDGSAVVLSHRIAELPGFAAGLAATVLPPQALFEGCRRNWDRLCSEGSALRFVNRLPAGGRLAPRPVSAPPAKAPVADGQPAATATHVLLGSDAWPLAPRLEFAIDVEAGRLRPGAGGLTIERGSDGELTLSLAADAPLTVNGEQREGRSRLALGDRLTLAGTEVLRLIRMRSDEQG